MSLKTLVKPFDLAQPFDQKALDEFKKKYQHDAFCKSKLTNLRKARKFLKYILKPEVLELIDLSRLQIDPETYVDEELKRLYVDVLYRIPLKNSNEIIVVFILIELKTENDKWTIFQIVKYIVRIWDREFQAVESAAKAPDATEQAKQQFRDFLLPTIIPIIFHYGENKFTSPRELIELIRILKGMEEFTPNMKALLCDVTTIAPNSFPSDQELEVLFMTLQMVFSEDVADHLIAIFQKLQPTLHLKESQQEWYDAVYYATTSAKNFKRRDYIDLTKQIQKEGGIPMSVSLLDELIAEGIAKAQVDFAKVQADLAKAQVDFAKVQADLAKAQAEGETRGIVKGWAEGETRGIVKGRVEGIAKGRAEGIVKGRAEGEAEMIIRILSRRLKSPPTSLQKKINSIQNLAKLDELADFALTCVS
ncbi:MAG: Rpn family recombination-promoting nuclease/putative transposase, partial [Planctomycetaceae bacterium]|nr:Rpn family recombination-promoting nuclease/putative transposase [Planctomycetaceae bacterium]